MKSLSETDRIVELAVQRDRANKGNALKRFLKSESYLAVPDEDKDNAKTDFLQNWVDIK